MPARGYTVSEVFERFIRESGLRMQVIGERGKKGVPNLIEDAQGRLREAEKLFDELAEHLPRNQNDKIEDLGQLFSNIGMDLRVADTTLRSLVPPLTYHPPPKKPSS